MENSKIKNVPSHRIDEYFIYSFYCDNRAKLSFPGIAQMLQESAWLHAESCNAGFHALRKEGLLWVLSALRIRINIIPSWGDTIKLNTWGRGYEPLVAYRDFEVFDQAGGEPRVQASSAWVIIDMETRRPRRITPDLQRITPIDKTWTEVNPGRFENPANYTSFRELSVLYSDLDVYDHVNNTRYIQWSIDTIREYHEKKIDISDFEIRFISEAHLDDRVRLNYAKNDQAYFLSGVNSETGKEIFRAKASYVDSNKR